METNGRMDATDYFTNIFTANTVGNQVD